MNTFLTQVIKGSTGKSGQLSLAMAILLFGFVSLGAACVYWDWSDLSESEARDIILALQRNPSGKSLAQNLGRDLWMELPDARFWPDDLNARPQFLILGFEKDAKFGRIDSTDIIEVRRADEHEFSEFPGSNKHVVTVCETGPYCADSNIMQRVGFSNGGVPEEGHFTLERDYLFVRNGPSQIPTTGFAGWSVWPLEFQYDLEILRHFDSVEEMLGKLEKDVAKSCTIDPPNRFFMLLMTTSEFMPQAGCYRRNFRHYRLTCNDK